MQNEWQYSKDCQRLNEAELIQIEGGFFGRDQLVHILPIRFPQPPIKMPIEAPVIFPIGNALMF